jgi:ssDNA-binding Zn-finger/Zn-ribbon topoisomerase 1
MAFGMSDLLSLLDEIPQWARIRATPERCDEIEKRLSALEQRPNLPLCEKCGVGYMRLDRQEAPTGAFAVFADAGVRIKVYKCDNCGLEIRKEQDGKRH